MGSSGGGSSSGEISYPAYMETQHQIWLSAVNNHIGAAQLLNPYTSATAFSPATLLTSSNTAIETFDTAIGGFVPSVYFDSLFDSVEGKVDGSINDDSALEGAVGDTLQYPIAQLASALVDTTLDSAMADIDDSFMDSAIADMDDTFIDAAIDSTFITSSAAALQDELEAELEDYTLPEYKGSMRDLNATVTSAFPIGEALLRSRIVIAVAKHSTELTNHLADKKADLRSQMLIERVQLRAKLILGRVLLRSELQKIQASILGNLIQQRQQVRGQLIVHRNALVESYMGKALQHTSEYLKYLHSLSLMTIEANRIAIVANKEANDLNIELDAKDVLFDLETYQYGANMLAAIAGGTTVTKTPDVKTSAIGGALSGAAAGAMAGSSILPGWGTAIGAAVGGIAGAITG